MRWSREWLWLAIKVVLAVVVVAAVGWQFVRILDEPEVRQRLHDARPTWLLLSGMLYLAGLGCWAGFWYILLRVQGEPPPWRTLLWAYYGSHLGKYVPGKAVALLLRTTIAHGGGVRLGTAAFTSVYETLTTMAAGAGLAVVVLAWQSLEDCSAIWTALVLIALLGVPLLPPVFNPLADRLTSLARRMARQAALTPPMPPLHHSTMLGGFLLTGIGWGMLGLSLGALLVGLAPESAGWQAGVLIRCTGWLALAYVAGFLAFLFPGGLGARELLLAEALRRELAATMHPEHAAALAWGTAILLRLIWLGAEVVMAGLTWTLAAVGTPYPSLATGDLMDQPPPPPGNQSPPTTDNGPAA
jgi:hypothetical protein